MDKWIHEDGLWSLFGWSVRVVEMTARFTGYAEVLSYRHVRYEVALHAELLHEGETVGSLRGNTSIPAVVDWLDAGSFEQCKRSAHQWFELERESAQRKGHATMLEALEEMELEDSVHSEFIRELVRKNSVNSSKAVNKLVLHRATLR